MKKEFENILIEHGIYGEDVEEIIYAVHDMLVTVADEIHKEDSYATEIVKRLERAAYEVFSLTDYIDT